MQPLALDFLGKLGLDIFSLIIIIGIHYKWYKKSEYIFTYTIFNFIIFLISYVMQNNQMSMGAAFGLFAVFSIIRYRTEDISTRDMTYLFVVIALGLLNAIHKNENDGLFSFSLIIYNILLVALVFILESNWLMKRESFQLVQYEMIENIKPQNKSILLQDLTQRTGYNVHRVEISKIDFLKDTALIKIYYYE